MSLLWCKVTIKTLLPQENEENNIFNLYNFIKIVFGELLKPIITLMSSVSNFVTGQKRNRKVNFESSE